MWDCTSLSPRASSMSRLLAELRGEPGGAEGGGEALCAAEPLSLWASSGSTLPAELLGEPGEEGKGGEVEGSHGVRIRDAIRAAVEHLPGTTLDLESRSEICLHQGAGTKPGSPLRLQRLSMLWWHLSWWGLSSAQLLQER